MALRTLGTKATTSLICLPAWSQALAAADVAAIAQTINPDENFAALLGGYGAGATAVIGTGSTHANTTLDTLVGVTGPPLTQIQVADLVIGAGILPATYVARVISGTSVQLSQAATSTAAGVNVVFVRLSAAARIELALDTGMLYVPGRGSLKVRPGDLVAIDNLGWPILVSGASVAYAGSVWNSV
jgi:hypothetical protein